MNAAAPRSRGGGKVAGRPTASRILHQKGPGVVPGAAMGQVYAWGGISNKNKKQGSCWWWDVPVQESSRRLEKQKHPTRPRGQGTPVPPLHPQNSRGRLSGTRAASLSAPKPPSLHPKLFFPAPRPHRHPTCHGKRQAGEKQRAGAERAEPLNIYTACHQPPGEEVATVQFQHKQHNNFFA